MPGLRAHLLPALLCLALLPAFAAELTAPDLTMSLVPLPGSDIISACEPVVMLLQTTNVSAAQVSLPAWTTVYTMQTDIRDEKGRVVAGSEKKAIPPDFLHTVKKLQPGETLESTLILGALYGFSTPGVYTVELRQFDLGWEKQQLLATARAKVTVQPFDAARLQARIEQYWEPMRAGRQLNPNTKILYSIRHNLALPALAWMVRQWGDHYAARAMRNIGTPEAIAQLRQLNAEGGRTAKAVHESVNLPAINMWYMDSDRTRVLPPPAAPAAPTLVNEPALALIDGPSGKVLFTLDDIVRFDWDRQIVQLTRERAMDLLALRVLTREFRLVAGTETIYRGGFYSPISSNLPRGPIITLGPLADGVMKVKPPLFQIETVYREGEEDQRFAPALRAILEQAGKLGHIDPAAVPPIQRITTEWYRKQGLNVRADIFPETFTPRTPARVHLWFEPGRDMPLPATVEILATVEDKEYHRSTIRVTDIPFTQIQQAGAAFILNVKPMVTAGPSDQTRVTLEMRGYREADGQAVMTHWITIPEGQRGLYTVTTTVQTFSL